MVIWKYELESEDGEQPLRLPVKAQILAVQMQGEDLCIWALVDPAETKMRDHTVLVIGTGRTCEIGSIHKYIGTVQDGEYVWHVFIN
jgi:hypothetical protein